MKIRTDFVTNSSSSSFIIARKPELSEVQKASILEAIDNRFFGKKVASTKEELDKYFLEEHREDFSGLRADLENAEEYEEMCYYKEYKKSLAAINSGLSVYEGYVDFEYEDALADLLKEIWEKLEETDETGFVGIDTDLTY